jgi:hypothetical protein
MVFNSAGMYRAMRGSNGQYAVGIYKELMQIPVS